MKGTLSDSTASSTLGYAENPVGAYHTIKRFAVTWKKLFEKLSKLKPAYDVEIQELSKSTLSLGFQRVWPQDADLEGAAVALLRLQQMYKLPVKEFAQGNVSGVRTSELGAADCFYIGQIAFHSDDNLPLAVNWIEESLKIQESKGEPLWEHLQSAYTILAEAYEELGNTKVAAEYAHKASKNADKEYKKENAGFLTRDGYLTELPVPLTQGFTSNAGMYERLCRGENVQDPKIEARLFCQYKKTLVPIRPVKEEVLYLDPRVSIFYDVITDKEADILMELAKPLVFLIFCLTLISFFYYFLIITMVSSQLSRSMVGEPSIKAKSEQRISKLAWLFDWHLDKTVRHLSKRVEEITGLSTVYRERSADAEAWQVLNYGIGGMYEPHHDFFGDDEMLKNLPTHLQDTGRRIATWLTYLTSAQSGGHTVFPVIKVRVPTVKNAAAFWYNLKRNGEVDHRTEHAGCPVLLGQKWISNKWIRERGQLFRRRCGLTPDALDE
ncbi:prolyl 4-hydroxylase subunit alpha-1 [Lingula anatina]|uniref:procollagen-proline 4-dioxygenase n=1 Tax=Lingula anatina TaxID=7574 RepID=A0A1S3HBD5_LINAN|nr:prolyl 4-hydroxylase subunit alpha-1 [Lingula anatina]|eukprot:XP_013383328.1 prolyl 4-hydroxylase subunit alpha-1 [Lingula anatina]